MSSTARRSSSWESSTCRFGLGSGQLRCSRSASPPRPWPASPRSGGCCAIYSAPAQWSSSPTGLGWESGCLRWWPPGNRIGMMQPRQPRKVPMVSSNGKSRWDSRSEGDGAGAAVLGQCGLLGSVRRSACCAGRTQPGSRNSTGSRAGSSSWPKAPSRNHPMNGSNPEELSRIRDGLFGKE